LAFFSVAVTLVFCLVLKPGGGVVDVREARDVRGQ